MSKRKFYAKRTGKKTTTPAIWIDGKRITEGVTERMKTVYYRMERRERYLEERDINKGVVHASDFYYEDDETQEQKLFVSEDCVQESAERNITSKKLAHCLSQLSEEEQWLIEELFFNGKSLGEISRNIGIHKMTLHGRKIKILEKLKKLLERSNTGL